MFKLNDKVYKNIDTLLADIGDYELDEKRKYTEDENGKKHYVKVKYVRLAASFDIEASSWMQDDVKLSTMYIWQFGIDGKVVIGRTWDEFVKTMGKVADFFELSEMTILPVYIHNLAYEFQWIQRLFGWRSIFAREKRSPMKALTDIGIEFRCSYMLSGCSLEQTAKGLTKYVVEKKVGDLDYDLVRHSKTPLTDKELGYAVYDVLVVMAYIQEQIEYYGSITAIPMTNTGRVREYCRSVCLSPQNRKNYLHLMKSLTISGEEEYDMLKRAFQGGFTHANRHRAGEVHKNVKSFDFTSSYPAVMMSELYPMSSGQPVEIRNETELEAFAYDHCIIFNVEFNDIFEKVDYENYISESKCFVLEGAECNNGRVMYAKRLRTTITNVDYDIIKKLYDIKGKTVFGKAYVYKKGYLPRKFIECVCNFYNDKTTLKDVEGMEAEYMLKKGMLNSCFGMAVTDIVNDEITYEGEWGESKVDASSVIDKYNKNTKRFLFYPWGVFITAYARRNLFFGICEFKNDYIYSDTDSIKVLNYEKHMDFITKYNNWVTERIGVALDHHGLDRKLACPKTVDGKEKPIGVWDDDGFYKRFKTLGAKRYLVEFENKDGENEIKCTIAGVNKKKTSKWLQAQENPFEIFDDHMVVPEEHSGRIIVWYNDEYTHGMVQDYLGQWAEFEEQSSVHMSKSDYNLKITPLYLALMNGKEEVISV